MKKLAIKKEKERESKDDKELKELNSYIQRLQQNVRSLEKRLDAVEKRLSNEPFENPSLMMVEKGEKRTDMPQNIEKLIRKLQDEIEDLKNKVKEGGAGGKEIKEVKDVKETKGTKEPKEPIISIRKSEAKKYDNAILNIERRLEKLERRKATVRVGKIEVPIEITGIVGGLIAFLIAILLLEGYKGLVISPGFVGFIGIVLIAATAVKTYMMNVSRK